MRSGRNDAARTRNNWRRVTLLWAGVIFLTSCTVIPSRDFVHTVARVVPGSVTEQGFDSFWASWWWLFVKGYHVFEFALLASLLALWLRERPLWLVGLIAAGYAATDEIHQLWVPQRGGRVTDWLIDVAGVLAASVLARWYRSIRPPGEI